MTSSGSCIPLVMVGSDKICIPVVYKMNENHMIFNNYEEIKGYFKLKTVEEWIKF